MNKKVPVVTKKVTKKPVKLNELQLVYANKIVKYIKENG